MIAVLFTLVAALSISVLLTPFLARFATSLGLVDVPDERKVHVSAIPRVGGIAIVLGALLPALYWLHADAGIYGYFGAALIIFAFGLWDDCATLDYRTKLLGQGLAILLAVMSGLEIRHLPFAGLDPIPDWLSFPLTIIFLVVVTNAFNLLDGLDGLAGGCAILSIGATAMLAFLTSGDTAVLLIAAGVIGGVLGFLRHNTHPATIFMGDAGSQFLGFTIGVLVIALMERQPTAMSAAVPLLLLGVPVLDTMMVFLLRIKSGRSPFAPDRRHIHHQLLSIGLRHHEAVAAVYVLHALLVFSAILLRFESDLLVIGWWTAVCAIATASFVTFRRSGGRFHGSLPSLAVASSTERAAAVDAAWHDLRMRWEHWLLVFIEICVVAYLVGGAMLIDKASTDLVVVSLIVVSILLGAQLLRTTWSLQLLRAGTYVAAVTVTYLVAQSNGGWVASHWVDAGIALLAIAIGFAIYFQERREFQVTTLDLLIAIVAIVVIATPLADQMNPKLLLRILVVLYAVELLLGRARARTGVVVEATVAAMLVIVTFSAISM
jgi:UDP-GlcNAc:undecaprenyl-phosphate/decaprenyl-phosphate GlcNAc-1-phosphate transferase